jgi:cytochrome c biogenesis protein CcmG, thiol:disulfide interchange protein DsbE
VTVALLVLVGCTQDAPATGTVPATNATTAASLPVFADQLPQMDATGFQTLMQQLRGTPVVVNYGAAGCDPCKAEVPLFVDAHARSGDRVQFVGVDMLDFRDGARAFMQRYGMTYPSMFDPTNSIGLSYSLPSPPMTQFWNADGTIVSTFRGQISEDALRAGIESIAP